MHEIRVEDLSANDIYVLMLKCDISADVADMWRGEYSRLATTHDA